MRDVVTRKKFDKDLKRVAKRGYDLSKLTDVIERLRTDTPLEPKHKPHPLKGKWIPSWDLHIAPDWILVYQVTDDTVYLVRTGTHADLFKNN